MQTTLPTIPDGSIIEYQATINYTDISTPTTTYRSLIVGLPVGYVVCGTCIRVVSQFKGPSLQSITCSLGAFVPDSVLAVIDYYSRSCELTQIPTAQSYVLSGPPSNNLTIISNISPPTALYFNGAHDIAAYFAAQGANLSTLTAGSVEVTVQIRPL